MKKTNCEKMELCKYCANIEKVLMQKAVYVDLFRAYRKDIYTLLARHPELEKEWDEIVEQNSKTNGN